MTARILIVDDVASRRIILKVRLATASYDVVQAASLDEAAASVGREPPAVVLLADRVGNTPVTAFCRQLRQMPAMSSAGIIVTVPAAGPVDRLGLLSAGADEILCLPLDEDALLARVRSLLRRRPPLATMPGLAEPAARFDPPGLVALVSADHAALARLKRELTGRLRGRIDAVTPSEVLESLRTGPMPDVFVLATGKCSNEDLRLLAELRSRSATEASAVLVIGGCGAPEFQIMALDLGASDVIAGPCDTEELVLRLRARLRQKRDSDRRRAAVERELQHAVTDPLTGLANRRAAFARLQRIAEAPGRGYALMILDLDRFKNVNDRHGHLAGDRVLREVARRLAGNLREDDLVARFGGEEFLVVLPDTPLVPARFVAERLRRVIEAQPVTLADGAEVYVTLSIGLCLGKDAGEDVETALGRADKALYLAKERGRNMVTVGRSVA